MSSLAPLDMNNLTPEQQRSLDAFRNSSSKRFPTPVAQRQGETGRSMAVRGIVVGPIQAWLRSPNLFDALEQFNTYARSTELPADLIELAILLTGRHWKSQYEFWAHAQLAAEAGLPEAAIEAIRAGDTPPLDRPDLRAAYDVVTEHFASNRVRDSTYKRAVDTLGERRLVDLIGIVGLYGLVSMTLNVFDLGVPPGEAEPLT